MLWIMLYCIVGAGITFAYKYLTYQERKNDRWSYRSNDDNTTATAVWSGVLWPVVAPFTFAVVLANRYAERKSNAMEV